MNIYCHTLKRNAFIHFKLVDCWCFIADQDIVGTAHLFQEVNSRKYLLMCSDKPRSVFPELDDEQALEYFNAAIYEAFLMVKRGCDCIDFYEFEVDLLPLIFFGETAL